MGCDHGCGRPAGAHVAVLATGDGYQVGRAGAGTVGTCGADRTAAAVAAARSGS
jgi:precorrin-3B synthase